MNFMAVKVNQEMKFYIFRRNFSFGPTLHHKMLLYTFSFVHSLQTKLETTPLVISFF